MADEAFESVPPRQGNGRRRVPASVLATSTSAATAKGFTEKEKARVLDLAVGLTYGQIASQNDVAPSTVKTQVSEMLRKLKVRSRYEIEDAVKAATERHRKGSEERELFEFLLIRLE